MSVVDNLERGEGFTRAERELADFILDQPEDVTRMGIAELAEKALSSNATIIRLCRKLGAQGYRDFRVVLAADLERERRTKTVRDMSLPFDAGDDTGNIMSSIAAVLRQAIDDTYATLSSEELVRAAEMIHDAERIQLYAVGDSQISTMAFANRLMKLGIQTSIADQYGETLANAAHLTSESVAVFVSYSGKIVNTPLMRRVTQYVLDSGCHTAWVSSADKPFGFETELRLPLRETKSGKIATFYSQMCIRYAFESLYAVIWSFDYADNSERKALADDVDIFMSNFLSL